MKTSRKILLPLATLVAAGAIAVGSGATFTSTTNNTISSVTSGTLTHSNSKDNAAIFDLVDLKPGDVLNGSLTITNTGTLPATFSLTETVSSNEFGKPAEGAANYLSLAIVNKTTGVTVYSGDFGGLVDGVKVPLGEVAPGEANDFTFTVKLDQDAPNSQQGLKASAAYQWDSVQLAGVTVNQ